MGASDCIAIHGDTDIDDFLSEISSDSIYATKHFTNDEHFFLRIPEPYEVPTLPIHHDVRIAGAPPDLAGRLHDAIRRIVDRTPGLFRGCQYSFDSAHPLKPLFYRMLSAGLSSYVYLMRLNLEFMPSIHEVLEKGSNDFSPAYRTDRIPVEALILPVKRADKQTIHLSRYVESTWRGETGRGYLTQGIWIDRDFAKLLSGVVLPPGHRLYPWYPVGTRYNSISYTPVDPHPENIDRMALHVSTIETVLAPHMANIESLLHAGDSERAAALARELHSAFPDDARSVYRSVRSVPYLNEFEQKEYRIDVKTI